MAYGSSDYAAEDYEKAKKLDDMVTEAKNLLRFCKSYIEARNPDSLAKETIIMMIEKFELKKV